MARELLPPVDGVLLILVRAINSSSSDGEQGIGLVLTVGGKIISGMLIPNWLWFRKVAENIRKSTGMQVSEPNGWADTFNDFGDQMVALREDTTKISRVFDQLPESAQQAVMESDQTEFIHLEDARVYEPGHPGIPANGMLWRGHLREISGWSLGMFEPQR